MLQPINKLSTKPKTITYRSRSTLHSVHPTPTQLHTYFQHYHHQVQLDIQYQELDQYGVTTMKHEIPGGVAYTLVVNPHNKP